MKRFMRNPSPGLVAAFHTELDKARTAFRAGHLRPSWRHLERAHILGQPYAGLHTLAHWKMLCFAFRIKDTREILGQLPRLLVGGVKSFVGHIPVGNTGGADVPPLQPMEIPADLAAIIKAHS
jgi:hypothetical protein